MIRAPGAASGIDAQTGTSQQRQQFREWLQARVDQHPQSLNGIETKAGIKGNALGKFLRGERGQRHGLTPLHVRRLAPVLGLSEPELMWRAGHQSHEPGSMSVEGALLADQHLSYSDKAFIIELYHRMVGDASRSLTNVPADPERVARPRSPGLTSGGAGVQPRPRSRDLPTSSDRRRS